MAKIKVSEDQVRCFRATRGHLRGPGADSMAAAASSILGAQSQQVPPSLLAISQRTLKRPTAKEVKQAIYGDQRTLVRTWGQRDTVHLYDALQWHRVVAADQLWSPGSRGGPMPGDATVRKARIAIEKMGAATRSEFLSIAPKTYVQAVSNRAALSGMDPRRFAAGRLLWRLAHLGHASIAEKIGTQQSYAARSAWFAKLPWPDIEPTEAARDLMRDYLKVHGPASPHDIAHFFGAKVSLVREWLAAIESECVSVVCDGRKNLMVLQSDVKELRRKPATQRDWPVRFLPMWESMLMAHADKSWTVPNEEERKAVWRKAAMVSAVVIDRGRIVATWSQKATRKQLKVQVQPLSLWRKTKHQKAAVREAEAVAAHLEIPNVQFSDETIQ